jgi:hypothetical protein
MPSTINWPSKLEHYPATLERFRATCIFFDIKFPPFLAGDINSKGWVSWGAMTALASIPEIFTLEVGAKGYLSAWNKSTERLFLKKHWLIATLKELRNFETHLGFVARKKASDMTDNKIISNINHKSFFFEKVIYEDIAKLQNIKNGNSFMNEQALNDFNVLAETHTVEDIINLALDIISEQLYAFVQRECS